MPTPVLMKIDDLDFDFENIIVRVTVNRSFPETKLAGLCVGPFEEGNEYEIPYWVGRELERSGIAHFRKDECLDAGKLFKIQWKERAQTAGQISTLPNDFYPKLRRYIAQLKEGSVKAPEKMREYETIMHLARDIVNSRLRKIIALASSPTQTDQIAKNLTGEERFLHDHLSTLIDNWRKRILEYEWTEE